MARKRGDAKIPPRHTMIEQVTKDTQGIMLYQEQVIDLLRGLGMDADNLTRFLKAVKASNKNIGAAGLVIESYRRWITERCDAEGMSQGDQDYLHEAIAGFAEYSSIALTRRCTGSLRTGLRTLLRDIRFSSTPLSWASHRAARRRTSTYVQHVVGGYVFWPLTSTSRELPTDSTRLEELSGRDFRALMGLATSVPPDWRRSNPSRDWTILSSEPPPQPFLDTRRTTEPPSP